MVIAQPGVGRIDKFIGDGIMATFGEHIVCSPTHEGNSEANRALVSAMLGIYSSAMLHNAFEKLRKRLFDHAAVRTFLLDFNDMLDIELGIGLNYGEVWFDFFGSTESGGERISNFLGDYLEYTAIGDHVNAAQRLEALASKSVSSVSLIARGAGRDERSPNFIAPIVLSRTVFKRVTAALQAPSKSKGRTIEEEYRSAFSLKGKGSVVEAYEVFLDEINGDYLIRKLEKLTSKKLSQNVMKTWKSAGRTFEFEDQLADRLAEKYFPGG
jgi:class 3 adenylate cyclase